MEKETNIFSEKDVWKDREIEFLLSIRCYLVEHKGVKYHAVMPKSKADWKKTPVQCIPSIGNIKSFLDNHKNILTTYGFWTCRCKTGFLQTPYSSFCEICNTEIRHNTNRAKYLEDI